MHKINEAIKCKAGDNIKRFFYQYKTTIIVTMLVTLFSLFFPYIVTSLKIEKNQIKIFQPEKMNKTIIVSSNSQNTQMDIEEYIPLVLYTMLPYDYEEEALKAQIVIIRTYILQKMGDNKSILADNIGLPYTSYTELEKKWAGKYEERYNFTMKLISQTNGVVMKYDDKFIYPFYHEISAGQTNDGDYDYLKSVASEADMQADDYLCISYYTLQDIQQKLGDMVPAGSSIDEIMNNLKVNMKANNTYVDTVSVYDKSFGAEEWEKKFGLSSLAFTIEKFSDGIKMICKGKGNGKGLSLYGAKKMAEDGKNYKEILKYYYSGISVEKNK